MAAGPSIDVSGWLDEQLAPGDSEAVAGSCFPDWLLERRRRAGHGGGSRGAVFTHHAAGRDPLTNATQPSRV